MGLLNLLLNDPTAFIILSIPLLYSIIIHELAHGWVAYKLGDPTAKRQGRLSLNPMKHLDPIGTVMLFIFGFGWAKPVPINISNIPDRRKGLILVSSAGIAANIILAFIALFLYRLAVPGLPEVTVKILYYLAKINIMLAAFNLIPIPPLDGSKILMGFASEGMRRFLIQIEPFGFFIIIALLYLGILDPLINLIQWVILAIIAIFLPR